MHPAPSDSIALIFSCLTRNVTVTGLPRKKEKKIQPQYWTPWLPVVAASSAQLHAVRKAVSSHLFPPSSHVGERETKGRAVPSFTVPCQQGNLTQIPSTFLFHTAVMLKPSFKKITFCSFCKLHLILFTARPHPPVFSSVPSEPPHLCILPLLCLFIFTHGVQSVSPT